MFSKANEFFERIDLDTIAKTTKFQQRSARKITPLNFLLSFFKTHSKDKFSMRSWALELSSLIQEPVSFQALDKKLSIRHLAFVKEVFTQSITSYLNVDNPSIHPKLAQFNRVLVEDSTCVKLNKALYSKFSGSSNGVKQNATCRIQLSIDLKTNGLENVVLTSYTHTDGSFTDDILERLKPNDLILRDLGYWKLETLRQISLREAFFISKLRSNTSVYTACGAKLDFLGHLMDLDKKRIKEFELQSYIGKDIKFPVRIIGRKLSAKESKIKRQKAKESRHKGSKISKTSEYLYSWNIIITNVPNSYLDNKTAMNIYRLRWQIEMFFKNWKSNFKIDKLLQSSYSLCKEKLEIKMLLSLIYMTVIYQPVYNYFSKKIKTTSNKILSPLKFSQFMKNKFDVVKGIDVDIGTTLLSKYFCYELRKDRKNYFQELHLLYLS